MSSNALHYQAKTMYNNNPSLQFLQDCIKNFLRFVLCPGFVISMTYESMSPNLALEIKISIPIPIPIPLTLSLHGNLLDTTWHHMCITWELYGQHFATTWKTYSLYKIHNFWTTRITWNHFATTLGLYGKYLGNIWGKLGNPLAISCGLLGDYIDNA